MSSISAAQLNRQFDPKLWPTVSNIETVAETSFKTSENDLCLELYVPSDLSYFAGHFPSQPVLPGVVQVHWAGELAKILFSATGFSELKAVKFNTMILPEDRLSLALFYKTETGSLRFGYTRDNDKCSSGSLTFTGRNGE